MKFKDTECVLFSGLSIEERLKSSFDIDQLIPWLSSHFISDSFNVYLGLKSCMQ